MIQLKVQSTLKNISYKEPVFFSKVLIIALYIKFFYINAFAKQKAIRISLIIILAVNVFLTLMNLLNFFADILNLKFSNSTDSLSSTR